jgi:lethal(2) giant larvae protein
MAIDLLSDDWRMLSLPYLVSLHASAVTCSQHVSGVPRDLWNSIVLAGKRQTQDIYSDRVSSVTNFKLSVAQTSYKVVCMKYVTVGMLYNISII